MEGKETNKTQRGINIIFDDFHHIRHLEHELSAGLVDEVVCFVKDGILYS